MTLHFLGDVDRVRMNRLRDALRAVPVEPIALTLDATGQWPGGVALLRPTVVPAALDRLHERIATLLAAQGFAVERRAYRAHVTLARRAHGAQAPQTFAPIAWRTEGFVLVESEHAPLSRYVVVERYG